MLKTWFEKQKGVHFARRCIYLVTAIILMGLSMSLLILTNFGTDPVAAFTMGLSQKTGLSFGTCLLLFNLLWFTVVIFSAPDKIGLGTLANMVGLGYVVDFFSWVWKTILPDPSSFSFGLRVAILIPSILVFVIAAAVYMTCNMGMAPDDAVSFICTDIWLAKTRINLTAVRMVWDATYTILGYFLGGTVGAVTILIIFLLGPTISCIRPIIEKLMMKEPRRQKLSQSDSPNIP